MGIEILVTVWLILRDVCLPILLLIGLGAFLDRRFQLSLETLIKLNIYLFVPAFIFVRVSQSTIATQLGFRIVTFTLLMIFSMGLVSLVVARLRGESPQGRKTLLLTSMFYNCGNFGIPLTALAFPVAGPGIQVFVLMTMNIATFTLGLMLATAQPDAHGTRFGLSFGPVLRQPSLYAIALAIVLKTINYPVSEVVFLWKPTSFLADGLVGLALVTLGVQLSQTRGTRIQGSLGWALSIRLIAGPGIATLLTLAFGFESPVAAVLILGAAAPTAVNTALLAHEFKADSVTAAAAVFYSTLLSFIPVALILLIFRLVRLP